MLLKGSFGFFRFISAPLTLFDDDDVLDAISPVDVAAPPGDSAESSVARRLAQDMAAGRASGLANSSLWHPTKKLPVPQYAPEYVKTTPPPQTPTAIIHLSDI